MEKKISIIGLGKMGMAIAKTLNRHGYEISGFDTTEVKPGKSVDLKTSIEELLDGELPVIIAVKPSQVIPLMSHIRDRRLIISIAAGISTKKIKAARGYDGPTIRVMPNTPYLVNEGISALYACPDCDEQHRNFALEIFQSGGEAFYLQSEQQMHAVTGVSGSGPAFVELFMQAMEDAGVLLGLPRDVARMLAAQTTAGSARLVQKSGRSPQDLIHDVTSPGGTTITGLQALKDFSFERAIMRAVKNAAEKSMELSGDT